jgi:imidazolonepropionase-like amidohydrolase
MPHAMNLLRKNNLACALRSCALLIGIGAGTLCMAADVIPARPQAKPIALVGGTLHPASGDAIAQGVVVFMEGKIVAIGDAKSVAIPDGAEVVDAAGKHIYPGLFDSYSNLGLVEIDAVRATRDFAESGDVNPNIKAQVGVNPDSELIPVTRANGVLLAVSAPNSSLIAGQSVVLQLDGWTWEEMTLKSPAGLHIAWPNMSPISAWWEEESKEKQVDRRQTQLKLLDQTFDNARAYQHARAADASLAKFDARWESMLPVLEGKLPIIVAADELQQIEAAVAFAVRQKVKLIIFGGYDAVECAALLKKHNVPVIVSSVYRLPLRDSDDYDAAYTLPKRLNAAGVKFCIAGGARFGASNVRNLPYHAATAVAFGLDEADALKAISLWPAEIYGVADRVGSLDEGKDATLFLADGNILETATQVDSAYVAGRKIDLTDKHKRLWRKYQERYRQAEDAKAAE